MALLLAVLAAAAASPDRCRTDPEFGGRYCPLHLPARRRIVVETVGQTGWPNWRPVTPCRRFRPTASFIARYLARAEETDRGTLHHALAESGCYAAGRVEFADGRVGRFTIKRAANMQLTIGRGPVRYIVCKRCDFAVFGND